MAGGFPHFRVHDDGGVESNDIFAMLDDILPPGFADVAFEFTAERAVVPETVYTAVDFGALKDESPSLAQRRQCFH